MMQGGNLLGILAVALSLGCSGSKSTEPDPKNHAPVMVEVRDTTAVLGDTLRIPLTVVDEDGDALEFAVVASCDWNELLQGQCPIAGVKSSVPEFWFWPRSYDSGGRNFTVIAEDGAGGSDRTDFRVTLGSR